MSKLRKRILTVLVLANLAVLLISVAYTLLFMAGEGKGEPSPFACKFKELTHLYCPGCGGSRSVYYLLKLDFINSFIHCPAVLVTALILAVLDVRAAMAFVKNDIEPIKSFKSVYFLIIPTVLLLNFLVRNILLFCGVDYIGDISALFFCVPTIVFVG